MHDPGHKPRSLVFSRFFACTMKRPYILCKFWGYNSMILLLTSSQSMLPSFYFSSVSIDRLRSPPSLQVPSHGTPSYSKRHSWLVLIRCSSPPLISRTNRLRPSYNRSETLILNFFRTPVFFLPFWFLNPRRLIFPRVTLYCDLSVRPGTIPNPVGTGDGSTTTGGIGTLHGRMRKTMGQWYWWKLE